MNEQEVEKIIREYIPQVVHMSLATSVQDKPWVCEVHFAYDDELNLYFRSDSTRRHCQELEENPNVAGNIVTQHFKNQRVRGVYFEGKAQRLDQVDESHPAYKATADRYGAASTIQATEAEEGPRYYKITVTDWYLFDSYKDPAQKYHLQWKSVV
jgi:uncharacterized protein YhbP (UPF0306 family)